MKKIQILILLSSFICSLQASESRIQKLEKEMLLDAFTQKASIKPCLSTIPENDSETTFQPIVNSTDQEIHIKNHTQTLIKPIMVDKALLKIICHDQEIQLSKNTQRVQDFKKQVQINVEKRAKESFYSENEADKYKFRRDNVDENTNSNKENQCEQAYNQLKIKQQEKNLPSRQTFQSLLNKVQ